MQTAPGVGPAVGGIGPEPAVRADITPVMPPRGPNAITQPELPAPPPRVAMLLEATPVPPEATESLLSGLLKGENESYFHKAKPASESSGEAAVAYAAGPHVISRSNPTPPPQPAVMLRRSLELDIASGPATPPVAPPPFPPPPAPASTSPTVPPSADRLRATAPTEMTMPLVVPMKGRWVDRWLAFVVAAALAGLVGVGMVRWLSPTRPDGAAPAPSTTAVAPPRPIGASPSVSRPASSLPSASATTAAATAPAASAAPTTDSATEEPGSVPVPRPGAASAQPGASARPPPKRDVKRAM